MDAEIALLLMWLETYPPKNFSIETSKKIKHDDAQTYLYTNIGIYHYMRVYVQPTQVTNSYSAPINVLTGRLLWHPKKFPCSQAKSVLSLLNEPHVCWCSLQYLMG